MPPIPLFVDADPSLATLGLDVDDDLALLFLLCSPEVELLGVTTVFGNSLGALAVMGGRARSGLSDFNVCKDPAAASSALALSCPKTLVTFDLGFAVAITPEAERFRALFLSRVSAPRAAAG